MTENFAACVDAYDRQVPFLRTGQYEWHRATIDARMRAGSVRQALDDEAFTDLLYQTLQKWGIGRRASRLVPLEEFRQRMRDQAGPIAALEDTRIDDAAMDVPAVCERIWRIIENLGIVENLSLIVPGTKALHHVLPGLVPPMDRAWTGAFFLSSLVSGRAPVRAGRYLHPDVHRAGAGRPCREASRVHRRRVAHSESKILDNAMIGYCKLNKIAPVHT